MHTPPLAYGEQPPWPFIPQRHAAKWLGVTVEFLDGLARNGQILAVRAQARRGSNVWLFNRAAVQELAEKLA